MSAAAVLDADATQLLASAELRVTRQRLAVLEALGRQPRALTATTVYEQLRSDGVEVGLATVYRTLTALSDAGLLHSFHVDGEQAFSRCPGQHDHVRCESGGRVVPLALDHIAASIAEVLEAEGFTLDDLHLDVRGRCPDCG